MAAVAAAAQAAVPAVAADFFLIVNTYTPVQKPAQGYFFAFCSSHLNRTKPFHAAEQHNKVW